MKKKRKFSDELTTIEKEVVNIEKEIRDSEVREALAIIESRHNFNLGLILGLIFAVVAGFFSIVAHEIFIMHTSYMMKLAIVILAFLLMVFCLIIGLIENKANKDLRKIMIAYLRKAGK